MKVPTSQSQGTWLTHTCPPATWLPATLAWDLSHFWGTEGPGEPHTLSVGTLCRCQGFALNGSCGRDTVPQALKCLSPSAPPSPPQPPSCSALPWRRVSPWFRQRSRCARSFHKQTPARGLSAAPASPALRLCARPKQSPFPASPSLSPPPCWGARDVWGSWDPLPALSQGGKPPAHRCHRPEAIRRVPLLRDREKLSRALSRLALGGWDFGVSKAVVGPSSFPSQPSSGPPFTAVRNVWPAQPGSHYRHKFLLFIPLLGPPRLPKHSVPRGGVGAQGFWGVLGCEGGDRRVGLGKDWT